MQVGNVLGGGSSVNFMMYTRGSKSDYDDWKTQGWGFEGLKPLFKKVSPFPVDAFVIGECLSGTRKMTLMVDGKVSCQTRR